jgi:hypothetical protein
LNLDTTKFDLDRQLLLFRAELETKMSVAANPGRIVGMLIFLLLAPLGLSQLILAVWLIVRGFRDPAQQPLRAPGAAG